MNYNKSRILAFLLIGIGGFVMLLFDVLATNVDATRLAKETLTIHTENETIIFTVEVAEDEARLNQGLMFRKSVPDKTGMLFYFGQEALVSMWMKHTLVPLDMLFIDAEGKIVHIAAMTTPRSLDPIPSSMPVVAVLEIAGGSSEHYGIKIGDHITHRIFHDDDS